MARLTGWLIVTFPGSTIGDGGSGGRCRSCGIPPRPSPTSSVSPTLTPSAATPSRTRHSSNQAQHVALSARVVVATLGRASR
jgi:hypothetical protein